jgi:lipopolysaccharide assembly protein B
VSDADFPLLVALVSLLIGLAVGKAWERYKLRDGRWIDRRKARQSPHYLAALNLLVSNQIDPALEELSTAAEFYPDALEIQVILGNLYREKGQVGRAITVHQTLLQRPRLTRQEHAHVLLCLGLDFRRGGFVDRALGAFKEVLRLDPQNRHAIANLQKLYEEQRQWQDAYAARQQLAKLEDAFDAPHTQAVLAFLENELGLEAQKRGDLVDAVQRYQAAIALDAGAMPAYLNLGDVRLQQGDVAQAVATWERAVDMRPERAYLAFERLQSAYARLGTPERIVEICTKLVATVPHDWRARLALAGHRRAAGDPHGAITLLFEALAQNPHAILVHQAIWSTFAALQCPTSLIDQYLSVTRDVVFYRDPHVCTRCRYRTTELLWHCPQCHEWNTFVEERLATARDEIVSD